jgi:hypothetical protein
MEVRDVSLQLEYETYTDFVYPRSRRLHFIDILHEQW